MSLSVLALGVALSVVPRGYACVALVAAASATGGFAVAFEFAPVLPGASGVLVVGATSALAVSVLALVEGLEVGLSFVPESVHLTRS